MTELTYPAFPKRALAALAAALVALSAIAVVVNGNGPDVPGCAAAAARVMTTRNHSIAAMARLGPGRVPACHGLTGNQYAQAVADAYGINYGRALPNTPISGNVPPASFRALSAQTESRER